MASACEIARAGLATYVAKLRKASGVEKVTTAARAGMLATAKTVERNVASNAPFVTIENLTIRPAAAALDYLTAHAKAARGGVPAHALRQIANTFDRTGLRLGWHGFREGLTKAVELMRTGVDPERVGQKFDLNEVHFETPWIEKTVRTIYNLMEAADKPFFGFAYQTSLYGRAKLIAIREGLAGKAAGARVNELLARPTEEMTLGAMYDAQYATFKNDTPLGTLGGDIRRSARQRANRAKAGSKIGWRGLQYVVDINLPFVKVAGAIANAGIDYGPFGLLKAAGAWMDPDPRIQAEVSRALLRATVGSGLTYLGYKLAGEGLLTGSLPLTPAERDEWTAERKPENALKLGDRWYSIMALGPLAIPILLGANIRRFTEKRPDSSTLDRVEPAVGFIGRTMTEMTFLSSVKNLIEGFSQPEGKFSRVVASQIPVPPIVGQARSAIDPTVRQPHTVGQRVLNAIPGASRGVPAKRDIFGETVARTDGGAAGAAEAFLDITNSREGRDTPLLSELRRLSVNVGVPGRTVGSGTAARRYSDEQYEALLREVGPRTKGMLSELVASPDYQSAPDEFKRRALADVIRDIRRTSSERAAMVKQMMDSTQKMLPRRSPPP